MTDEYGKQRDELYRDSGRAREIASHEGRHWLKWGLGVFALLSVVGVGMSYCSMAAQVATVPAAIASRTLNADNIIYNYEWFHSQYRDVLAFNTRLTAQKQALADFTRDAGPRVGWDFDTRQEFAHQTTVISGIRAQRASMIETYNAHATMANRGIFQTGDLPPLIEQPAD